MPVLISAAITGAAALAGLAALAYRLRGYALCLPPSSVVLQLSVPVRVHRASPIAYVPVKSKPLLTPNEREFWGRLERALPDCRVLPQVAMGALVETSVKDWSIIKQFHGKICDFAVLSKEGKLLAVIELDDVTHDTNKDRKRDEVLASAGIPTLRFHSRAKPSPDDVRAALNFALRDA